MKTELRYCRNCRKDTRHDIWKDEEGLIRIIMGILTLGFSEGCNFMNFRCQECGEETKIR